MEQHLHLRCKHLKHPFLILEIVAWVVLILLRNLLGARAFLARSQFEFVGDNGLQVRVIFEKRPAFIQDFTNCCIGVIICSNEIKCKVFISIGGLFFLG